MFASGGFDAWSDWRESHSGTWDDAYEFVTYGLLVRFFGPVVSIAGEALVGTDTYRGVTHVPSAIVTEIEIVGWEAS